VLQDAYSYLTVIDPGRTKYAMLITDGCFTCPTTACLDPAKEAAKLLAAGIKTYVVGFGTGVCPTELDAIATSGGTALPGSTKYYDAANSAALTAALSSIASKIACGG
jgi:hypothetical protein